MPLLPGETRERDTYHSGLGLIFDDGARSVRQWADSTQVSVERWWQKLKMPTQWNSEGQSITQSIVRIAEPLGPLAPALVDIDDPNLWRVMLPSVAAAGSDVYHKGDPLKKCPATMMLIMGHACAFTHRVPVGRWGLRPAHVIEGGQMYRLLSAPFVHLDLGHLIANMSSLLRSGYVLEQHFGSWGFLSETLFAAMSVGLVRLSAAVLQMRLLGDATGYYHTCALGFSSACIALKVLAQHHESETRAAINARLRGRWDQFYCWSEVFVFHLLFPNSDLLGHVCGMVSGLLRVHVPREWPELEQMLSRRSVGYIVGGRVVHGQLSGFQGGGGRLGRRANRVQIGSVSVHPLTVHAIIGAASLFLLPLLRRGAFSVA